ncbi:hypothetical protein MSG28_000017 [Choristoneura fumiferana]|uniref:Uncharacterized protein n=1 Tax=Choristoneura fumiferana TaxID=7141 RepID=A0ACC0JYV9_CHOFU|nr:hypothetical protein MSG28_000017 [Choristoneura fumiferana]
MKTLPSNSISSPSMSSSSSYPRSLFFSSTASKLLRRADLRVITPSSHLSMRSASCELYADCNQRSSLLPRTLEVGLMRLYGRWVGPGSLYFSFLAIALAMTLSENSLLRLRVERLGVLPSEVSSFSETAAKSRRKITRRPEQSIRCMSIIDKPSDEKMVPKFQIPKGIMGQPTCHTHPHMIPPDFLTCGITQMDIKKEGKY